MQSTKYVKMILCTQWIWNIMKKITSTNLDAIFTVIIHISRISLFKKMPLARSDCGIAPRYNKIVGKT